MAKRQTSTKTSKRRKTKRTYRAGGWWDDAKAKANTHLDKINTSLNSNPNVMNASAYVNKMGDASKIAANNMAKTSVDSFNNYNKNDPNQRFNKGLLAINKMTNNTPPALNVPPAPNTYANRFRQSMASASAYGKDKYNSGVISAQNTYNNKIKPGMASASAYGKDKYNSGVISAKNTYNNLKNRSQSPSQGAGRTRRHRRKRSTRKR
jgi:hypothetical protein